MCLFFLVYDIAATTTGQQKCWPLVQALGRRHHSHESPVHRVMAQVPAWVLPLQVWKEPGNITVLARLRFLKLSNENIIMADLCHPFQFNTVQLCRYEGSLVLAKPWDSHLENKYSDVSRMKGSFAISY